MRIYLLLLTLILSLKGITQFQDYIPQVKLLQPDAAGLFKPLERPVGPFTGTVPVDLPLCGLNSGGLSADLSLSYTAGGGLKVEEMPGSVGLGFSLDDGGGRIVQIVNGIADDQTNGIASEIKKPSNFNCASMTDADMVNHPGSIDLEPDIFMYHFHGESGKFLLTEGGNVVILNNTGIKITYDHAGLGSSGISYWIITDSKGDTYLFNNRSYTSYNYQSISNPSFSKPGVSTSTWFLTQVTDMNGENKLSYTYQSSGSAFTSYSGGFTVLLGSSLNCDGFNLTTDQALVTTGSGDKIVSRIDGSSGYILIHTTDARPDPYHTKVDDIELHDSTGALKKKFRFNYGCFNGGEGDVLKRRLKLSNYVEYGSGTADSAVYKFDYEESQNLPSRISYSVDYWGYFNNKINTDGLYPNVVFNNEAGIVVRRVDLADRSPDPIYGQANILKKITWPTGGYRQFTYEGNTALMQFNKDMYMPDPAYTTNQSFITTSFLNVYYPNPCLKKYFTVNSTDGGAAFTYTIDGTCDNEVKVYKLTTANQSTGGALMFDISNQDTYTHMNLNNGYYRLELYNKTSGCTFNSITGAWGECTLSSSTISLYGSTLNRDIRNIGGVRVKQIDDYDPVSAKTNTTQYIYKLYSKDSTLTSGLLISDLNLFSLVSPVGCDQYKLLSNSSYPLSSQGGSYVVYPEVRTIETGNGWNDRVYSYVPDEISTGYPDAPPSDNSNDRGQLQSEKIFNSSGTLLKKSLYSYTGISGLGQEGIKVKTLWYWNDMTFWYDHPYPFTSSPPTNAYCTSYGYSNSPSAISSVIDSTFTPNGATALKTDYIYDTTNARLVLSQKRIVVNNSLTRVTSFKYPFTANNKFVFGLSSGEISMKTTLNNNNYLQPLELADSLNPTSGSGGNLTSGGKFIFANFNGSKIHLSKARSYTTLSDSTEINFTQYDYRGNLMEKYTTGDIKEVYLWGYKGCYPVAKVTGSDYTTVSALVTQSVLTDPSNDAALRTELNKIRTGLANTRAQVTTFTYNPKIGMTSMTDPSGKIIYYDYDGFGRLMQTKDANGYIIKKYNYKMNNQ